MNTCFCFRLYTLVLTYACFSFSSFPCLLHDPGTFPLGFSWCGSLPVSLGRLPLCPGRVTMQSWARLWGCTIRKGRWWGGSSGHLALSFHHHAPWGRLLVIWGRHYAPRWSLHAPWQREYQRTHCYRPGHGGDTRCDQPSVVAATRRPRR